MLVSIVVPCYRSADTLPTLVAQLTQMLPTVSAGHEIVLVVDGSPDDTWPVACSLAERHPSVRAIRLARNYGQHNALIAGVRAATHEVIVTMDDDLQHPPEEVPALLGALTDDLDLVYGVAAVEEHGPLRSAASRFVKTGMRLTLGVRDAAAISAFRAFRSFLVDAFAEIHGPHVSLDVALAWGTTRVGVVEVTMRRRSQGRSNYTIGALLRHTVNMIVGYSTLPLRLVTYLGLAVGAAGMLLFARVLWLYFSGATTIAGFTTTAAMVAVFSSAQLIGIGVLGEYVGRIHAGGMGRPTYVIRQTTAAPPRAQSAKP